MARLRKFTSYRRLERPYTRISKYKNKSFIKAQPRHTIVRFNMGHLKKKFKYSLDLKSKSDLQIRHNAIEAARQSSNRLLENQIGPKDYSLNIMIYPHHIIRENPVAAGAGADRFSTGMSHSFGKPHSVTAQVKKGQTLFRLSVNKNNLKIAREALKRVQKKLPCGCLIETKENK